MCFNYMFCLVTYKIIKNMNEITGLNAEETYKAEKSLWSDILLGNLFETPTLDDYAKRNGLVDNVEIK